MVNCKKCGNEESVKKYIKEIKQAIDTKIMSNEQINKKLNYVK